MVFFNKAFIYSESTTSCFRIYKISTRKKGYTMMLPVILNSNDVILASTARTKHCTSDEFIVTVHFSQIPIPQSLRKIRIH